MNSVNLAAGRPSSDDTTSIDVPEAQGETGRLGAGSGLDLLRAMVAGEGPTSARDDSARH